jgi:hypothetical protein
MAALYAIWKRLSHLRIDGINYDICGKEREDGRISVAWICLGCCEQGPPIPAAESLGQAVAFAKIGLRAHHGLVHNHLHVDSIKEPSPASTNGHHEDVSQPSHKQAAYDRLRAAFEKMCMANDIIRSYQGKAHLSKSTLQTFMDAYRDWSESSCNFDAALKAYAVELTDRAKSIEVRLQGCNGLVRASDRPSSPIKKPR